jgi:hypothetical protein
MNRETELQKEPRQATDMAPTDIDDEGATQMSHVLGQLLADVFALYLKTKSESLYLQQQNLPWSHTADLTGSLSFSMKWTVFDGGARKNRLAEAEDHIRQAEAQVSASRDQIEDEVWAAYANLTTAFRQREADTALFEASTQSYAAELESYN